MEVANALARMVDQPSQHMLVLKRSVLDMPSASTPEHVDQLQRCTDLTNTPDGVLRSDAAAEEGRRRLHSTLTSHPQVQMHEHPLSWAAWSKNLRERR